MKYLAGRIYQFPRFVRFTRAESILCALRHALRPRDVYAIAKPHLTTNRKDGK